MKFLTFTDVHAEKKVIKTLAKRAMQDDVEFSICAGDFSNFGSGFHVLLEAFEKIKKPLYVVPGNHEEHSDFDGELEKYEFCQSLHGKAIEIGGYVLMGFGGGGFSFEDAPFRKVSRGWYGKFKDKKTILVTHQAPFGTTLDVLDLGGGERHVGNKDYLKFVKRMKPKLAISGHLHETFGEVDTVGKTKLINPGDEGMVVELP